MLEAGTHAALLIDDSRGARTSSDAPRQASARDASRDANPEYEDAGEAGQLRGSGAGQCIQRLEAGLHGPPSAAMVLRRVQEDLGWLDDQVSNHEDSRALLERRYAAAKAEAAALGADLGAARQNETRLLTASSIVRAADAAQLQEAAGQLREAAAKLSEATARVAIRDGTIDQLRAQLGQQARETAAAAAAHTSKLGRLHLQAVTSCKALRESTARVARRDSIIAAQRAQRKRLARQADTAVIDAAAAVRKLRSRAAVSGRGSAKPWNRLLGAMAPSANSAPR